jgi:hypothetical protein
MWLANYQTEIICWISRQIRLQVYTNLPNSLSEQMTLPSVQVMHLQMYDEQ